VLFRSKVKLTKNSHPTPNATRVISRTLHETMPYRLQITQLLAASYAYKPQISKEFPQFQ